MDRDWDIEHVFNTFDYDRSGTLDIIELGALFRNNGVEVTNE